MEENNKFNEFKEYIDGKKVGIIGLGVSNIPLLEFLTNLNAKVVAFDKREEEKIDKNAIEIMEKNNIEYFLGENALKNLKGFDMIFCSPTCRHDLKELIREKERGAILTSEIEMLLKLCPCKVIGVTGSDGKTTTTSLIYEILKKGKYNCHLGGNIGIPLFTKIESIKKNDIVILELSSFQLLYMDKSPDISVITNISPNHLDVHKSYEEYIEAKKNIFTKQNSDGLVILNYDDEILKKSAKDAKGKVVFFSKNKDLKDGVILDDGIIKICKDGIRRHIVNTKDLVLKGEHNYINSATAVAATKDLCDIETIKEAIKEFKGVEHRLEFVREIKGAKWYNDSIGTSPTRTIAGLNTFNEPIVLIAGGYDKNLDYTPVAKPILDNVRALILMGATKDKIKNSVEKEEKKQNKTIEKYEVNSLEEAVKKAYEIAKKGEVVLFSPASASFDLFKNFEERGNAFKKLVKNI